MPSVRICTDFLSATEEVSINILVLESRWYKVGNVRNYSQHVEGMTLKMKATLFSETSVTVDMTNMPEEALIPVIYATRYMLGGPGIKSP